MRPACQPRRCRGLRRGAHSCSVTDLTPAPPDPDPADPDPALDPGAYGVAPRGAAPRGAAPRGAAPREAAAAPGPGAVPRRPRRVAVTGSAGKLGRAVVADLI